MIFNHRVKCNGVYYEAGQEVPMGNRSEEFINADNNTGNIDDIPISEENTPKRGRPKKVE